MKKVERASEILVSSEPVAVCRCLGTHIHILGIKFFFFYLLLIREKLFLYSTLNNVVFECFPASVLVDSIYC